MLPGSTGRTSGDHDRPIPANTAGVLHLAWARNALALLAMTHASAGQRVLLPAYHCPALVEPFSWSGASISFYPMEADLAPDIGWLDKQLTAEDILLLVPFAGVTATLSRPLSLARERGCLVIEDLAHAAFKRELQGDYGVTSLQKFYPVQSGAELLLAEGVDDSKLTQLWKSTITGESAWRLRSFAGKIRGRLAHPPKQSGQPSYRYLQPEALGEPMRSADKRTLAAQDASWIAQRRRERYVQLSDALDNSTIGAPLYPHLGPDDTPYVFPFLLRDAATFAAIRSAALPLYRWEEIATGHCEVSDDYRHRLVQLPCHQDLADSDMELLLARLDSLAP